MVLRRLTVIGMVVWTFASLTWAVEHLTGQRFLLQGGCPDRSDHCDSWCRQFHGIESWFECQIIAQQGTKLCCQYFCEEIICQKRIRWPETCGQVLVNCTLTDVVATERCERSNLTTKDYFCVP